MERKKMMAKQTKHRWALLALLVLFFLPISVAYTAGVPFAAEDNVAQAGAVIYVKADANGTNNGDSWADAYTNLQDALAAATVGDEIWVAAGTYKPTVGTDRTISFQLKNGVALYGGFNGTETAREERDWQANVTILSGDLNGDDNLTVDPDESSRAENSLHVVLSNRNDSTARLSGFTITGGNANGDNANDISGGGMINLLSHPTITDITFIGNSAENFGGGMYSFEGGPTVTNATFENNSAQNGGGMCNSNNSNPEIRDVLFTNNRANMGGGVSNHKERELNKIPI